MTTLYKESKWDNPDFLMDMHENANGGTHIIKFAPTVDAHHSRSYELAGLLFNNTEEQEPQCLWVAPYNGSNLFRDTGYVGEMSIGLLYAFRPMLNEIPKTLIDVDADLKETVSFSVVATHAYHQLPGVRSSGLKKEEGEMMEW